VDYGFGLYLNAALANSCSSRSFCALIFGHHFKVWCLWRLQKGKPAKDADRKVFTRDQQLKSGTLNTNYLFSFLFGYSNGLCKM